MSTAVQGQTGDGRSVVGPAEGDEVFLGGFGVVFKLAGSDTGGAFSIVEHPMVPGYLVPPHTHEREDEYSYVLSGTIGARVGDQEFLLGPGGYLCKPRGISHAFWNPGPEPARVLEIIAPAGFEAYFRDLAPLFASGADIAPAAIDSIAARYGLTFQWDQLPGLIERYGVSPR
jgi:mannose-6-phosphate isomerase-like protein (cupin superfamily)